MSESSFNAAVGRERAEIQHLAEVNPGIAYLGEETGQFAIRFDPPVDGVARASITATTLPPVPRETAPYYHAAVQRRTESGGSLPEREVFRHPFPALDWLYEHVPDLDLRETVPVDATDDSSDGSDRR